MNHMVTYFVQTVVGRKLSYDYLIKSSFHFRPSDHIIIFVISSVSIALRFAQVLVPRYLKPQGLRFPASKDEGDRMKSFLHGSNS